MGGLFGGILAGVISDRLEKRASTCGLMLLLAAPTLYVFSAVSRMGLEATIAMLLLSGALVSGPYALITTAVSADLGTHKSLKGNSHALNSDSHHRWDGLCRSCAGPLAGRAHLTDGMEQCVLHVDVCRRLCLTVPGPPHPQGAELSRASSGEPSSAEGTLTSRPVEELGLSFTNCPLRYTKPRILPCLE